MPNYHKHWYGTLAQYNALASKDSNTLYHCSEGLIYRGSVLLATRRWGDLSGVPSTFAPSAHTHDDRYYTETEVDTLLTNKANWDAVVTDFAGLEIGGRNLIIENDLTTSVYLNNVGDVLDSTYGWAITDYIPVEAGSQYIVSGFSNLGTAPSTVFYNASKEYISGISGSQRKLVTAPSGSAYMRFTVYISDLGSIKLEKGNKATDWTPAPEDVVASIATVQTNLDTHAALANNPHSVTKTQVGLGNVENTKLSTWAGSGSITALGTVVSGTWNASTIAVTKGGTGKTSVGKDKMLYATANNAYGEVATTSFGRGLLSAVSGTVVSGLNADTLDGSHSSFFHANAYAFPWGMSTLPWANVATLTMSTSSSNVNLVLSIASSHSSQCNGILKIVTRTGSTTINTPEITKIEWLLNNNIPDTHFVLTYVPVGANMIFKLWAYVSGWEAYSINRISETGWGNVARLWTFHERSVGNTGTKDKYNNAGGWYVSIPPGETQVASTNAQIKNRAASATILANTRTINGVNFNGSANITITAATPYTLTRGSYLTGSNFNGSANTTWAVDATSANTAGKVVARDSNGDFACRTINAVSGIYSLKVVTGGHNYASQTYGVGIGTDGSNSGVIFYDGTGATGRIFREADVMRFTRGGLTYSGFDINANGSITVQGDMTTRTSLVVGSTNGTYVQIGSARLVYDQTNNAIKVVNADNSSCSLYATGSISAFGIGSSGGSGTSYSRLDDWADYVDGLTNDYVLSAELGYDLHTRVNSLNSFQSGTSWGNSGTGVAYLSIGGTGKTVSLSGHSHAFSAITNKPNTLGGYGITNAMPLTGGTLHNDVFNILELKRNSGLGASIKFSNNNEVLAKLGFDNAGSFIISRGTSADGTTDMFYINAGTRQITGYGSLNVSGNIETGTSHGSYIRAGQVKFLYDNSVVGIRLMKNAGGYAPLYAGSVYANEVQLTSSRSMKKDIMPFKNGLDLIKSIDVVSYLYKQDSDDDDRKIGFIADDTDSWLSGKSKTKYNIGNTVGALIKAVQELEKKNQELEQRLLSITNNN